MEIRLFRTTVSNSMQAELLKPQLDKILKNKNWNFDLEDCDKVLRIEATKLPMNKLISLMKNHNHKMTELY